MSNIKFINTGKKELCLVMVPKDAKDIELDGSDLYYRCIFLNIEKTGRLRHLPKDHNYKLIAPANEITDEQAKEFVDELGGSPLNKVYKNHENPYEHCLTSLDSFKSLLQANECYSENPYGLELGGEIKDDDDLWSAARRKWQQAEQNVGNWIVLEVFKKLWE